MSATTTARRPATLAPVFVALAAGVIGLGLVFMPECIAAVRVWTESTAYGHCYLVAPIAAYLLWDRRDSLRGLVPQPTPMLLLLGLPLPLMWFAAERLGIMEGRQLAALGFVELLVLVMLGWTVFRAILGPMLYLVFLVPFGAFVTPALQSFTAHFIDYGLILLGIPHFSNDMFIEISGGTFFVAEACAGLRFLIASIAFGVFYALLNYRHAGRRAVFIAASIVVPIVANGFRALGIVVLGQVLGSAEAAAADHLIYGWVFFSAVMLLLVAAGLPMREADQPARVAPLRPEPRPRTAQPWPAVILLTLAATAPAAALALDRNQQTPHLSAPPALVAPDGCQLVDAASDAPNRATATLRCAGRQWLVSVQALPARSTGSGLADARNRLLGPMDDEETTSHTLRTDQPGAGSWQVFISRHPAQVTAVAAWVRGRPAGGGLSQRLLQARDSLLGADIPPVLIGVTTKFGRPPTEAETEAAIAELTRFVAAQPGLTADLVRITAPR